MKGHLKLRLLIKVVLYLFYVQYLCDIFTLGEMTDYNAEAFKTQL